MDDFKKFGIPILLLALMATGWEYYQIAPWYGAPKAIKWLPFSLAFGTLRARFPDTPAESADQPDGADSIVEGHHPSREHWFTARGPSRSDFYMAGALEFSSPVPFGENATAALAGWARHGLNLLTQRIGRQGGMIIKDDPVADSAFDREYQVDVPGAGTLLKKRLRGTMRVAPRGAAIFMALAITPDTVPFEAQRRAFLDGFDVGPALAPVEPANAGEPAPAEPQPTSTAEEDPQPTSE